MGSMIAHTPTAEELSDIREIFPGADLSLIKGIYYFDGWADFEEDGGILIFQGIDDSIQIAEYGHCVTVGDSNSFDLEEVDEETAKQRIQEMLSTIDEGGPWHGDIR